ncbi:hypothetical protein [Pontibaca methylaminivorans]|uniref:Uncharacterized protein n=1 Tax=Pontibaca methylaminivorans TaxID=515897 RepID=A0A1R3WYY2_9RHOB|nr:hypothetical protein [Pontibaca methylaminivorans]SIT83511.1 hypothetical protein SAMN05421849_1921 [Pontibaca methylaminivorans]
MDDRKKTYNSAACILEVMAENLAYNLELLSTTGSKEKGILLSPEDATDWIENLTVAADLLHQISENNARPSSTEYNK